MIMKKFISAILTVALIISLMPGMTLTASASLLTEGDWEYTVSGGNATIIKYNGSGGSVVIPSTLGGIPVTVIGNHSLASYTIGETLMTSVTIPNSVTTIGDSAFRNSTSLTSVTIGNSVATIGDSAFMSTGLTSVAIPNSVTSLGESAFRLCASLTSATIGNGVTAIGRWTFNECTSLTSVTIGNGVKTIGADAFSNTALTNVIIPDGATRIDMDAFNIRSLKSITIPNSVTDISNYAIVHPDVGVTIRCYASSTAHTHARTHGYKVELITGAPPTPPPPAQEIKVLVNGAAVTFDQPPIIENGRTLVPLRAIFEALGADVEWEHSTQTVTAVKDDITIVLKIGDAFLTKNGERIALDVPAKIVGGRTLVPARAVAESFGADVQWDQATRTVTITE